MPLEHKDRISDTSNTTGTGTLTLTGTAPAGRRSFASGHTTGATVRYAIESGDKTQWEVGEGVWTSSGATLTRDTVFASSNSNALVNFTGTPLTVISTMTAADASSVAGIIDKIGVYLNAATTATSSADQKIPLDTVAFDTNSIWDATNKRITPKKAGYYHVDVRIHLNSAAWLHPAIRKNGTTYANTGTDMSAQSGAGGGVLVYCNGTTDYLEFWSYVGGAVGITTGGSQTYMHVFGPF